MNFKVNYPFKTIKRTHLNWAAVDNPSGYLKSLLVWRHVYLKGVLVKASTQLLRQVRNTAVESRIRPRVGAGGVTVAYRYQLQHNIPNPIQQCVSFPIGHKLQGVRVACCGERLESAHTFLPSITCWSMYTRGMWVRHDLWREVFIMWTTSTKCTDHPLSHCTCH